MELRTLPATWADGGDPPPVLDDAGDGAPAWNPARGTPLVPGLLAWYCIWKGRRRETWLCWSLDLWAPVVVKLVRPGWTRRWAEPLDREFRALTALAHPAMPRLLVDGRSAPLPHIGVEWLDGPSLGESVQENGPFRADDVARLGVLVLGVIRALHATGNAHLDVSPNNVLLVDRRPRLIDLGASRPLGTPLNEKMHFGTNGFQAPEIAGGAHTGGTVTPGLDVYALAATLLFALDPETPGAEELLDRMAPMTDPDPAARPGPEVAMAAMVKCAGTGPARPWPRWADAALPRAPRRRRLSRVGDLVG